MTPKPKLHIVNTQPLKLDISYEYRERQHIASRDWSRVHIEGEKNPPLRIGDRVRGVWR